jgi:hypothetical protein
MATILPVALTTDFGPSDRGTCGPLLVVFLRDHPHDALPSLLAPHTTPSTWVFILFYGPRLGRDGATHVSLRIRRSSVAQDHPVLA